MGYCYYCGQQKDDLRRCAQCRVVAYCSKACQKASWNACHKDTCLPNEAIQNGQDADYEGDKRLSKWIETWRIPIYRMECYALDLGTYPNRNVTDCFLFILRPRDSEEKWKHYEIVDVSILPYTKVQEMYPELHRIEHKTSPTRLRCVFIEGRRARVASADDPLVAVMRNMPPIATKTVAQEWHSRLVSLINEEGPTSGTLKALSAA